MGCGLSTSPNENKLYIICAWLGGGGLGFGFLGVGDWASDLGTDLGPSEFVKPVI
jgi:hypothetical protein